MKQLLRPIKRLLADLIARVISPLLNFTGVQSPYFKAWEAAGFHITPVHFYQPIPDTRELAQHYPEQSSLTGIDWNVKGQLALLKSLEQYSDETRDFPAKSTSPDSFYLDNAYFEGIDPHIYYCLVRHFKPRKIIEVGAGFSTLIAAQAAQKTGTQVIAIEPYPRDFIAKGVMGIQHIQQRAEDLKAGFFDQLEARDMLFIDSSHVVKTGGDVNFLLLEVLPRLKSGVIVHIHDIFLPYDYPREWPLENHWFWTEQYLVDALLIGNARINVLLANNFLAQQHNDVLKRLFPSALCWKGGSMWLQVK